MSDKKKKFEEIPVNDAETEVKEVEEVKAKKDKHKKGPACLS